jgi:protein ImuB
LRNSAGLIIMTRIACVLASPAPAAPVAVLRDLLEVALAHSPRVEEGSAAHVFLDAAGLAGLFGSERALAERLVDAARARGHAVRVAIAGSRVSALYACRMRDGVTVIEPGDDAAHLAPAPVALLDAAPEMMARLDRWGIRTLGELAALPPAGLLDRLGADGLRLHRCARGEDRRPLEPWVPPPILEESVDLDDAVDTIGQLVVLMTPLAARIADRLVRSGLSADHFEWVCRLADRTRHKGSAVPAVPMNDGAAVASLLRASLEAWPPKRAVEGVVVRARPVRVPAVQASLMEAARPSPRLVTAALARIAALVGAQHIGVPVMRDSHRSDAVELAAYSGAEPPAVERGAPAASLALCRFRPRVPARVTLVAGRPVEVRSHRLVGRIVNSAGPWRVSGEWWSERPWLSDEWDVELSDHVICRLAHDGSTWWLDGIYD